MSAVYGAIAFLLEQHVATKTGTSGKPVDTRVEAQEHLTAIQAEQEAAKTAAAATVETTEPVTSGTTETAEQELANAELAKAQADKAAADKAAAAAAKTKK